jgi:hypothetical protein
MFDASVRYLAIILFSSAEPKKKIKKIVSFSSLLCKVRRNEALEELASFYPQ